MGWEVQAIDRWKGKGPIMSKRRECASREFWRASWRFSSVNFMPSAMQPRESVLYERRESPARLKGWSWIAERLVTSGIDQECSGWSGR